MADWQHRAACRNEDPDRFFIVGTTPEALQQIEDAKAFCHANCGVIEECLRFALERGHEGGVFGGTSETERRALKRKASRGSGTSKYGPEVVAEAVRLFDEVRGTVASDWAAYKAVASHLGISRIKTVKAWIEKTPAESEA